MLKVIVTLESKYTRLIKPPLCSVKKKMVFIVLAKFYYLSTSLKFWKDYYRIQAHILGLFK